ncbi:lysophospholipase L1-like esterase [Paenibacillus shirakamiensis]|uniref:Lysophospholipase L1-like esterase n=1 Tax=Paenibacillus shirakamiensis TaxID=1265935 RepID=A0ABS4JKB7_9BACL|nr:SGNH/GDSL hydrolase family protein [Paenibacillus shirakamiensis]MBP2002161.1 lysophospholipase L1-like esterase [Paenibacillus shirakamiensis]
MHTILCFGDSNTWGYDAATNQRFDTSTRWTRLLGTALGKSVQVLEEGLSGRTSVHEDPLFEGLSGLSYIHPCLMSHAPLNLVIIMLGTNDTKERFGLTAYNIAQGIVRLAVKAKATNSGHAGQSPEVLVIAPPPIRDSYVHTPIGQAMGKGCSEKSEELSQHLAALLQGTGIHFADAKGHVIMNEIDYMHLDEDGHRRMAQCIHQHIHKHNLLT